MQYGYILVGPRPIGIKNSYQPSDKLVHLLTPAPTLGSSSTISSATIKFATLSAAVWKCVPYFASFCRKEQHLQAFVFVFLFPKVGENVNIIVVTSFRTV